MMTLRTETMARDQWTEFMCTLHTENLLQTGAYGDAKRTEGWDVVRQTFHEDGECIGAVQVLTKRLLGGLKRVAWINRGPLMKNSDREKSSRVLHDMLCCLNTYWVENRGVYVCIAPPVSRDTVDLCWMPKTFHLLSERGWSSARVSLAESTMIIRARCEKKWRNSLAHAERQSLTLTSGMSIASQQCLLDDYQQLLQRKDIPQHVSPVFLKTFLSYCSDSCEANILSAFDGVRPLGSILAVRYGKTTEYLVGAVREEGRGVCAGQWLLWHALLWAKEKGCQWFDVGGCDPLVTEKGIMRFKQGLNGVPYQYIGWADTAHGPLEHCIREVIKRRI